VERGWQIVEGKSEAAAVGSGSGSGSDWRSLSSPTNCALDPAHQPEAFKTEKAPPSTSIKCNVRNACKSSCCRSFHFQQILCTERTYFDAKGQDAPITEGNA
jgi:hypothetical protein